ncbi:hypothetical protein NBRC116583_08260 [Arenicella sp. 4NH20-0111]|uniref:hypothetical protein n=1 Tax=Arenicella sp. 4NH20-0111 TaxID=3127648 RepID=UPI003109A704
MVFSFTSSQNMVLMARYTDALKSAETAKSENELESYKTLLDKAQEIKRELDLSRRVNGVQKLYSAP